MAAQTYGSTGTQTVVAPRVNLLPPEIAEGAKLRRAQLAMVGTGLAAVAVVGVMYVNATAKVSDAESSKTQALAANSSLKTELTKLGTVKETYAQVDAASKTLELAMHYEVRWSTYLYDLTLTIPENVWLNKIEVSLNDAKTSAQASSSDANAPVINPGLGTVKVTGSAFSHDDVAAWLESLAKQKGYSDPYFTKSEDRLEPDIIIVDFDSTAYLTEKALANRYAKGLGK